MARATATRLPRLCEVGRHAIGHRIATELTLISLLMTKQLPWPPSKRPSSGCAARAGCLVKVNVLCDLTVSSSRISLGFTITLGHEGSDACWLACRRFGNSDAFHVCDSGGQRLGLQGQQQHRLVGHWMAQLQ